MRPARHRYSRQRGFTLIELMIVVVILAVLAVVVIPGFFRDSVKKQFDAEVGAIFAEFLTKQEQYKIENGVYLTTAVCPATPVAGGIAGVDTNANCITAGSDWNKLRMNPAQTTIRCTYQATAGLSTDVAAPPGGFTFNQGVGTWWYVIATCDMDGKGAPYTQYLSGFNNTVAANGHGFQTINYGQ